MGDIEGSEGEKGSGKGMRKSLLLINKSDLLSASQRWVDRDLTFRALNTTKTTMGGLFRFTERHICILFRTQGDARTVHRR